MYEIVSNEGAWLLWPCLGPSFPSRHWVFVMGKILHTMTAENKPKWIEVASFLTEPQKIEELALLRRVTETNVHCLLTETEEVQGAFSIIQKGRKICGLGCVNQACTRARVTQPGPHIFLYICSFCIWLAFGNMKPSTPYDFEENCRCVWKRQKGKGEANNATVNFTNVDRVLATAARPCKIRECGLRMRLSN